MKAESYDDLLRVLGDEFGTIVARVELSTKETLCVVCNRLMDNCIRITPISGAVKIVCADRAVCHDNKARLEVEASEREAKLRQKVVKFVNL